MIREATIPFIARHRKEKTGSLDEVVLSEIRDGLARLAALDCRRQAILKSLEEQNVLTAELRSSVESAATLTVLEDIYLPYRPKQHTRGRHSITNIMLDWHIYLIRCHDGSLYTGITTDVARRFAEHQGNGDTGAKYLRGRGPLILVFKKKLGSRSLALGVESKVKKLSKARKEELIRTGKHIEVIIKQVGS